MSDYANPDALADTQWLADHAKDGNVRVFEVDVDTAAYEQGHVDGATGLNWRKDLQQHPVRDLITKQELEELLSRSGAAADTTIAVYGDNNNWFAAYGFWLFRIYGHKDVRLMNGGRVKWLNEKDKPLTTELPNGTPVDYKVAETHLELRAMLPEVMDISRTGKSNLVDVRSPDEFSGKVIAPPGMSETAQRGGHIPGAKSVPWSTAVQQDGTFKSADELQGIYLQQKGVDPKKPTVAYCRIGERSSHTWFVLKYLLGLDNVKNYDGSWTEYGNVVAAPIEKG